MGLGVRGLRELVPQNDSAQKAAQFYNMAQNQPRPVQGPEEPGKSISGALATGMGGAAAGAQLGTLVSMSAMAGPYGAAIGGAVALGSYLLS